VNGTIWLCMPGRYTVGLVVQDGVGVQTPPIARRWAHGRAAGELWREAQARGAIVKWRQDLPDDPWYTG
jgi:hypothetical protein